MQNIYSLLILLILLFFISCSQSEKNPFWGDGEAHFEVLQLFENERFPNIVVAKDGTLIATWGSTRYQVRRSEDGGKTWGEIITVADPGFQGGGTIVDEQSGDILVFVEEGHPPSPLTMYRSPDQGRTWNPEEIVIHPDESGNIPSMHMNEYGITLQTGTHKGRLIRPSRYYGESNDREYWPNHYTNAIFSDDGGKTWHTSAPFPVNGTGEAALVELSDGRIYYNSRRHYSGDRFNPRMRHIAWSDDGGETWKDLSVSEVLPDGDQSSDYGLMAGLVRLPVDSHDILLYSNIESDSGRKNGVVWASFDGGETWPAKRVVEEGPFAYSSMAVGRKNTASEGQIYLFYEGEGGGNIARFNLAWVTKGRDWREFLQE